MTSVNENSIGLDLAQEEVPSARTEQDQEFSDRLEDLLNNVLNQSDLSDVQIKEEHSNIPDSSEAQAVSTESEVELDFGSDDSISIETKEERISDLTDKVDKVESGKNSQIEQEDLDERLAAVSSFFKADSFKTSTDKLNSDVQISGTESTETKVVEDASPESSQTPIEDDYDHDYFDCSSGEESEFESISNVDQTDAADHADADDFAEIEHRLQEIASQIECSNLDETDEFEFNDGIQEVRSEIISEDIASENDIGARTGLESIEDKLTDISSQVEVTAAQSGRIENIEKQIVKIVEAVEKSDQLPIAELTDAIEQLKTDVNYNDQCTTATLETICNTLDQLSGNIDAGDVLKSDDPISDSGSISDIDASSNYETSEKNRSQNPEEQPVSGANFDIEKEETHLQDPYFETTEDFQPDLESNILNEFTPPIVSQFQEPELNEDEQESEAEYLGEPGLEDEISAEIEEKSVETSLNSNQKLESSGEFAKNEFIEAARRAVRASTHKISDETVSFRQSGQEAVNELRDKISTERPKFNLNGDEENNFITGFAVKPLSSRYTAVVASALFIAASSTLFVGQIAPRFMDSVESNSTQFTGPDSNSNKDIKKPSTGIANDSPIKKIAPKIKSNKREFAEAGIPKSIIENRTPAEIVRTHHYSASETGSLSKPVTQGITVMEPRGGTIRRSTTGVANKDIINTVAKSNDREIQSRNVTPASINLNDRNSNLLQDTSTVRKVSSPLDLRLPPAYVGPFSLRSAAATGNAVAQYEVGSRLSQGPKKNRNYESAFKWFSHSASQGYPPAQYRLGAIYERGLGTPKDNNRAQIWYRRAAENGNIKAMHNLAVLLTGTGNKAPDYSAAAHWFEMAANYDLKDSQFNLAILYENGLGVRKNPIAAYKWISLSALGGDTEAQKRKELLRTALVPEIVSIVDQSIKQWKPKIAKIEANQVVVPEGGWRETLKGNPTKKNALNSENRIRTTQILLKKLGYDVGPIDGQMGRKTSEAIATFQKRSGDTVNGKISNELIVKLSKLAS